MNEKRISIRFDLDDETDREAWEYLNAFSYGSRQNTVKVALLKAKNGSYDKMELSVLIKQTIESALSGRVIAAPAAEAKHEIPNEVMNFLDAL